MGRFELAIMAEVKRSGRQNFAVWFQGSTCCVRQRQFNLETAGDHAVCPGDAAFQWCDCGLR
ncbi:MAG: hypothetical protein GY917_30215, partial [Planctomycetaceae bacterium]|nr:hypothetical protein [Planctomycetaceae bacterium]